MSHYLEGMINLFFTKHFSNVTVRGLSKLGLSPCDVQYPVDPAILNFTMVLTQPVIKLETHYKLNALAGGIIPIFGEGLASLSLNFSAGVMGQIAMESGSILELNSFDYVLGDLSHFNDVKIEGLLENSELAETVAKIVETVVIPAILAPLVEQEAQLHVTIVQLAPSLFKVIIKANMNNK